MRSSPVLLVVSAFCLSAFVCAAQTPASAAPAPEPPSQLLRPSLDSVQLTLDGLRLGRWKRGSVRDEASDDIAAIQHEIRVTLPPLLRDADALPQSLGKSLPVAKHVGAVYDVLLRVFDAARISAPVEQVNELQMAMRSLERARLALNDRMQSEAVAQELQISQLRMTVEKQAAFKCPAPPRPEPCVKPKPRRHTRHRSTTKPPAGKKAPETPAKPKTVQ